MALKVPGKLRRIDTNEASAESQLSAEHTWTQGSAIQGYYQRQACLAAATLHLKQTRHWHRPAICFLELLRTNGYGEERSGFSHF